MTTFLRTRPVMVTWRDTTTRNSGWETAESAAGLRPSVIKTVGFVLRRSRSEIVLAQSISDDGDAMAPIVIPRGWVQRTERL